MNPSASRVASRWLMARKLRRGDPRLADEPEEGHTYHMDVADDLFVHFTTSSRANEILASGKLLMRPPHKKFGIDVVNGISAVYGEFLPGVQLNHVRSVAKKQHDHVVALVFKTRVPPEYGMVEEVIWKRDVPLTAPRILPLDKGVSMLMSTPERLQAPYDQVVYQ